MEKVTKDLEKYYKFTFDCKICGVKFGCDRITQMVCPLCSNLNATRIKRIVEENLNEP